MRKPYKLTGFTATRADAYRLFHEGSLALAQVEANGVRINTQYVEDKWVSIQDELDEIEDKFWGTPLGKEWRRAHRKIGGKLSLKADDALRVALYDQMKLTTERETGTGKKSTDKDALELLTGDVGELRDLLRWRKLEKARNTYFAQIRRETKDGVLHPQINLHTVVTYRPSTSNPNLANIPARDAEIKELIRTAFLAHDDEQLGEGDYSGVEVRVAACYNHDPNLIAEVTDKSLDMHRDMAAECFKLDAGLVSKPIRHLGKNDFVFPQFYGEYSVNCARAMWNDAKDLRIVTTAGVPLLDHLKSVGLGSLGRLERQVEKAENRFWGQRFKVYDMWRDDIWAFYQKHGYVDMQTGFRCSDISGRNKVINRPIQGSAFHCLLWSLVQMQKWLNKYNMKTKIINQIYDSMILSIVPSERDAVLEQMRYIMETRIREEWKWLIVPMAVDIELAPVGGSWFDKGKFEI